MYHYTECGLRNVWLANGYEIRDTPFGKGVSIHNVEGLTAVICNALTKKPIPVTGAELRFLRNSGLLLSQPALGNLIGVDGQSVARWEKSGRVPKWADKLIRLLYLEHANGNVRLRSAFETIRVVERAMNGPHPTARVVVETNGEHWESRVEDLTEA